MTINKIYLNNLNKKISISNKIKLIIKNIIMCNNKNVIQIGVGGYPSTGKTVLIDAMFSFFDETQIPGFIPKESISIKIYNKYIKEYKDYQHIDKLRRDISNNFHKVKSTEDNGSWNFNTYYVTLRNKPENIIIGLFKKLLNIKSDNIIVIIRNLPGEMFKLYLNPINVENNYSICDYFEVFINEINDKDKKKFNSYINSFKLKPSKINIEEIYTNFFEYLNNKVELDNESDWEPIKNNFFAFLFYYTSNFNVYCIKANSFYLDNLDENNRNELENIKNTIIGFNNANRNILYCFTKFDLILKQDILIDNTILKADTPKDRIDKYWKLMSDLIAQQERLITNINQQPPNITNQQRPEYIIDECFINSVQNIFGLQPNIKLFTTSVAYNYSKFKFLNFDQNNFNGENYWVLTNNALRTSLGVLELTLHILHKAGLNMDNSGLPINNNIDYSPVYKKIYDL